MSNRNTTHAQHPITQDIPLPGNYPCLTLQLNVTRYASGGLGRYVCVLREPSDGLEISRSFGAAHEWPQVAQEALSVIEQALANMVYLQLGDNT